MTYAEIELGHVYEEKTKISSTDVNTFAEISGDKNPLHIDEEFAKKSIFGQRIAHGILVLGKISAVLGMRFPGNGTIYMQQSAKFKAPVFLDEELTVRIEVKEKIDEKFRLILITQVIKEDGKVAIDGEALVQFKK
ncbi:MaoC family dehydratase [Oceanotoga sp. DSM 15011]|jgi:3-hydroxybutyryl-CoA dehydratase|uniref:3-hydroxybutyryl-CoA dehydratase n=1 Tax=Oceanotoga teriensis TaxID=515440 RepID=A0AA45C7Y0_9BACT|nr:MULTISPECIES: MaoC family dehydratase [Oceanotoga]MDN5341312.1 3-hydroxybutyryl-CoA dehydratase [Oceanotoga sp.]MDO7976962.1 MaoC family dehydratase [Oceanotoga teriensis]PWJ95736.1 3-hydroxybutyryl-CoA dehydratase [Oceanotoga teriensis]UYO99569.1 MaoC family dehydratase [Oceanotoga sp. DSM 15011]